MILLIMFEMRKAKNKTGWLKLYQRLFGAMIPLIKVASIAELFFGFVSLCGDWLSGLTGTVLRWTLQISFS